MAVPHLDISVEQNGIQAGAIKVLSNIRPQWQLDNVSFKVFTDGITNKLIGCFYNESPSDVILVRVYGTNTDLLIDRKAETATLKYLQNVGFTPPLFATFNNGLVYQYIPGEVLTVETVRDVAAYPLVARKMAQLHKVRANDTCCKPMLWPKLEQFISLVPEQYAYADKQIRYVSIVAGGVCTLRQELVQLTAVLSSLSSPVVFCHNDLLLANVIYRPGAVSFIDYEYADFNYQAFDIGNHFDEFAGVTEVDFSRYPDENLQLAWLRVYLMEYSGKEPTEQELKTLFIQVNKFALAAHFFWGIWSLVQAAHSNIDFDFLNYAGLRLKEYFTKKDTLLALELPR